ncbi:patatin-like phospholipase family protein [Limobrevibacterium gyesilva]|uniref:Patatin-like phospholipase family protein n=1 Tax=Limobrevibacterium gyesilva TaxID=2991712 RepID=A0AA42CIP4_9PROT|nr:patatin-like phospholipase family protein [Limobrevibacterium gyesilva]MCW3476132.1 patatin-like phospholipase family protein [Limobrevibacterium gyesilva]
MDAGALPPNRQPRAPWRPENCDHVALVLQGGGALGAYQAGVYQALHEAGLEPDWVAGVSIGGINSAIIAGNPPERRLERLREFWEMITTQSVSLFTLDGDDARRARNGWSALLTTLRGQPGFFDVNMPGPWLSPRGSKQATSFYNTAPLRETLLRLVDFDLINSGQTRFACGAVNVANGNFYYFDNATNEIVPEHVMASGALPPALPMVRVGTDCFWDGGLVSNTPLSHLVENIGCDNVLVFQVDLFSARGSIPRDMHDVLARQKDIRYSSRTRLTTDMYMRMHKMRLQIRQLLARIPEAELSADDRVQKQILADLPEIAILHLIYQQADYESQAKDYEFSAASMRDHWDSGYRDTRRTLRHKDWLRMPAPDEGIVVHDVHRVED